MRNLLGLSLFLVVTFASIPALAKTWQVGPNSEYKLPSDVSSLVDDGDIVEISSGVYQCDGGVKWEADNLTIIGVGNTRPQISWIGCDTDIPGGKGLWNPSGFNFTVDNIEFLGAEVADRNGAGIRFDGGGRFVILNSAFFNNQNGILVTPYLARYPVEDNHLLINNSEFGFNGAGDGRSHNMYIQNINQFTMINSHSHNVNNGHLVKSIALVNKILGNKLDDGYGTSSYHIDITGGGPTTIVGNLFVQTQNSPNYSIVAYAAEATSAERNNPNKHFNISFNTIINEHDRGHFLSLFNHNGDLEYGRIKNNLYIGFDEDLLVVHRHSSTDNLVELTNNVMASSSDFANFEAGNYKLSNNSNAVDASNLDLVTNFDIAEMPLFEFSVSSEQTRAIDGTPDVGAFELDEIIQTPPSLALTLSNETVEYLGTASITWQTSDADHCYGIEGLAGVLSTSGTRVLDELSDSLTITIECEGAGGKMSQSAYLEVLESPKIDRLPQVNAVPLPNTMINDLLRIGDPIASGVMYAWPEDTISVVHVPEQHKVLINGGGHRAYYGNEVVEFNTQTKQISLFREPTDIYELEWYEPSMTTHSAMFDFNVGCHPVWKTFDGTVAPAGRKLYGSLVYDTKANGLLFQGGIINCYSFMKTSDGWLLNLDSREWELLHEEKPELRGTSMRVITHEPESGLNVVYSNAGTYTFDAVTGETIRLNTLPERATSTIYDPTNDMIYFVGNGTIFSLDANTLTDGSGGVMKNDWELIGNTSILSTENASITYNTRLNMPVIHGSDSFFFLDVDKEAGTIEFLRMPVEGLIDGRIVYIEELGGYLEVGSSKLNMNLFVESVD